MPTFFKRRALRKELKRFRADLRRILHQDDDILSDEQKHGLALLQTEADTVSQDGATDFLVRAWRKRNTLLPVPSFRTLREWVDILAVAGAVAFGIRGLYAQPFKIPTGSMQPTLYGIHFMERENKSNPVLGNSAAPVDAVLFSASRAHARVAEGGIWDVRSTRSAGNFLSDKTSFRIGNESFTLPGAPNKVWEYTQLDPERNYAPGDVLCDGYLSGGDHLVVDRVGHYIGGLHRGDVVVFNTENILYKNEPLMRTSGYYYIKRLVGLPGDTLRIADRQLWVRPAGAAEFSRIQELDARFKKLYSAKGGYQGHDALPGGDYLATPESEFTVPPDSYFMLGDNARFSLDSRAWGVVPRKSIVGRALTVFWPFSRRWGMADRTPPLDVPTGEPNRWTYPSMYLQ